MSGEDEAWVELKRVAEAAGREAAVDTLNATVRQLIEEVRGLRIDLSSQVEQRPTRPEIRRTRRIVVWALAGAIVLSNVITFSAVSNCFLEAGHPSICSVLPGYDNAEKRNDQALAQFESLLTQIPQNQREIADLKARIKILEEATKK